MYTIRKQTFTCEQARKSGRETMFSTKKSAATESSSQGNYRLFLMRELDSTKAVKDEGVYLEEKSGDLYYSILINGRIAYRGKIQPNEKTRITKSQIAQLDNNNIESFKEIQKEIIEVILGRGHFRWSFTNEIFASTKRKDAQPAAATSMPEKTGGLKELIEFLASEAGDFNRAKTTKLQPESADRIRDAIMRTPELRRLPLKYKQSILHMVIEFFNIELINLAFLQLEMPDFDNLRITNNHIDIDYHTGLIDTDGNLLDKHDNIIQPPIKLHGVIKRDLVALIQLYALDICLGNLLRYIHLGIPSDRFGALTQKQHDHDEVISRITKIVGLIREKKVLTTEQKEHLADVSTLFRTHAHAALQATS